MLESGMLVCPICLGSGMVLDGYVSFTSEQQPYRPIPCTLCLKTGWITKEKMDELFME
jgi:hypothetical protein